MLGASRNGKDAQGGGRRRRRHGAGGLGGRSGAYRGGDGNGERGENAVMEAKRRAGGVDAFWEEMGFAVLNNNLSEILVNSLRGKIMFFYHDDIKVFQMHSYSCIMKCNLCEVSVITRVVNIFNLTY
uniref:Uncharacterized protein n=1 Tax=Oryza rufipogon TaxID=4529 RepID=A0A0E0P6U3_ORYRU